MKDTRLIIAPAEIPNHGILFADHQKTGRTGHLGHALVEYAPGKLLAFYPNCDPEDPVWNGFWDGHSGFGWMEYRRSEDGGETWSEPVPEPNSKALFDRGIGRTMMCEKAVSPERGRIVLFYVTCDVVTNGRGWEPYYEPCVSISADGGRSFSEARPLVHKPGRIFDACFRDGRIYVLLLENPMLPGIDWLQEYPYCLYVSDDGGETFSLLSELPFQSTMHCFYGTMEFLPDGSLIVYIYDEKDEYNLKYMVSTDGGMTWGVQRRAFFARKLRNPQMIRLNGRYLMHGRSGNYGNNPKNFVLYTSQDGTSWDEGRCLCMGEAGYGEYSNNLLVHTPEGRTRVLIQASHAYRNHRTNVLHWWIDVPEQIQNENERQ